MTPPRYDEFLKLSAALTGFELIDLVGTGMGSAYFKKVSKELPPTDLNELFDTWVRICDECGDDSGAIEHRVHERLLTLPLFAPVIYQIVKLWYLGIWYRDNDGNKGEVVSADAYTKGLVWRAIGAHPPGAEPTGFGSWASEPPPGP
jgi:hypothetical protein